MNASDSNEREHFCRLLRKFDTAMLVTHTADGKLRARPMAIADVEDSCRIWFFTGRAAGKVHEIDNDTQVNVVCQHDRDTYVSLSGLARVTRDGTKIDQLWKESFRTWFPDGKDDPDLALIAVDPEDGEYWDNEGFNKIKYLFEAAKAYASGSRPHIDEGQQHAKVTL